MGITKKRLKRELIEVAVLAVAGAVFNIILYDVTTLNILVSMIVWIVLAKGNGYIVESLDLWLPWLEKPILRVLIGTLAMIIFTVVAFGSIYIAANWYHSARPPLEVIRQFTPSNFTMAILITTIISMFLHGRAFYINWKQALYKVERLKNESLKSRYESLKNQVNPHFLFNSLNVLSELVYEDQKKAVDFIRKMSNVYRYVLENKDQELVHIKDELNFVSSYGYLQKIRFAESLDLQIDVATQSGYVPPLAIQLLLENAIKHNIVSESRPLTVKVSVGKDTVTVENNLQEKKTKDSTGIGLQNLKDRYKYLSEREMEISHTDKVFKVTIPILQLK